ncbi:SCO3374 family protein [Streptomyces sp. NPDC059740]|uniref:SCO3374 family protein n=1 Tax=Streptomyces sp. NPDC059740 TaxID=3346926 RepID=UPI0036522AC7
MASSPSAPSGATAADRVDDRRRRYEDGLGWATSGTEPLELLTGLCFDVLSLPADAGAALLGRGLVSGPVALATGGRAGPRLLALVAPGSAEELPGLLQWLEWGDVPLELAALGAGERMPAPEWLPARSLSVPAGAGEAVAGAGVAGCEGRGRPAGGGTGEAARWVRPPGQGGPVGTAPAGGRRADGGPTPLMGPPGHAGLVRLVGAAATECHRAWLARCRNVPPGRAETGQALAFSNASLMSAGTRPRSLTL